MANNLCLWDVEGNKSIQRKSTQGEYANFTHSAPDIRNEIKSLNHCRSTPVTLPTLRCMFSTLTQVNTKIHALACTLTYRTASIHFCNTCFPLLPMSHFPFLSITSFSLGPLCSFVFVHPSDTLFLFSLV